MSGAFQIPGLSPGASTGVAASLGGLGGLFGGLGGTNASSKQQTSGTSTTSPVLSSLQQQLRDLLLNSGISTLQQAPDLSGYTAQGLQNNQVQGNSNLNSLRATLAQRGLTYSPLAGSEETATNLNTSNQNTNLINSIPLLQRQLQLQALQGVGNVLSSSPFGSTTTQEGQILGSGSTAGNVQSGIGGALGGVGSILGIIGALGGL